MRKLRLLKETPDPLGAWLYLGSDSFSQRAVPSLVPELEENSQPVPSLELVEEQIRQILSVRKTSRELDQRTAPQVRRPDPALPRPPPGAPNLPRELQLKMRRVDGER